MNLRHLAILRSHGYKRRHIKALRSGAVTYEELYRPPRTSYAYTLDSYSMP